MEAEKVDKPFMAFRGRLLRSPEMRAGRERAMAEIADQWTEIKRRERRDCAVSLNGPHGMRGFSFGYRGYTPDTRKGA